MPLFRTRWSAVIFVLLPALLLVSSSFAGVSRAIQEKYRSAYENKALFLRIPIYAEKQNIFIRGRTVSPDQSSSLGAPRFKVGDQIRVLEVDFGGDEIKFKLAAISGVASAEIIYKFDANLADNFPNSDVFDEALESTFTAGLQYSDLDQAKRDFIGDKFQLLVRQIADSAAASPEDVLKNIAPLLPAYRDAQRDIENLKGRNKELSSRLAQLQSDNRKTVSEAQAQQAEVARLRGLTSALQENADGSKAQVAKLNQDLNKARGLIQGYMKDLSDIQRSLSIKVDANRELSSQVADLGQVMQKLQKDKVALEAENRSLHARLEQLQAESAQLSSDLGEARNNIQRMQATIATLTSKEDSLARQYLNLKKAKENLDTVILSGESLRCRTVEDRSEGGVGIGKAEIFLKSILLGSLEWQLPEHLSPNEQKTAEVRFSTESIDYVKVSPEERQLLRSLGERLKLRAELSSPSDTMEATPEKEEILQEIGERDNASWRWMIFNRGTQDTRLMLEVSLINRNSDEITVLKREYLVTSASVVRQMRGYLQPVPVAVGTLLGFLLFGVVGIFRRVGGSKRTGGRAAAKGPDPSSYAGQKRM